MTSPLYLSVYPRPLFWLMRTHCFLCVCLSNLIFSFSLLSVSYLFVISCCFISFSPSILCSFLLSYSFSACFIVSIFPSLRSVLPFSLLHCFVLSSVSHLLPPFLLSQAPVFRDSGWHDVFTTRTRTWQLRLWMNKHFPWQWTPCRVLRPQKCVICRTCINSRGCRALNPVRAMFV